MSSPTIPGVYVNVSEIPLAQNVNNIPGEGVAAFGAAYNIGPTNPILISSWLQFVQYFGTFADSGNAPLHHSVYQFFNNGGSNCYVVRAANTDAVAATQTIQDIAMAADDIIAITAQSVGAWGSNIRVALTAAGVPNRFNLLVYLNGTTQADLVESFYSLSVNPADYRFIDSVVNSPLAGSAFINTATTMPASGYVPGTTDPALQSPTALTGGSDGSTAPVLGTALASAFDQLQDQVLYVNVPGAHDATTVNALQSWADSRGDVMIIVDPPAVVPGQTSAQVSAAAITAASAYNNSANVVCYTPNLYVLDPASGVAGAMRYVAPGGAVLGIWDKGQVRYGVQNPPAGTWATVKAQALEANFTSTDLANLLAAQVNPVKRVPNVGFCVYGARTQDFGVPSRYINTQRAVIKLTHDMENLLAFAVFQPNDSVLWSAIVSTLNSYLLTQMQDGMFAGNTPATAFSVTCDSTNNTFASVQAGVVNVAVGVALVSAAEFIVINLQQLSAATTSTS